MSTAGYIFGGPDRSGKTTIARALSEMVGAQYYKNTEQRRFFEKRPNDFILLLEYHGPAFLHFLENVTIPGGVVIDRFTPCEYAYAMAFGRTTNIPLILDIDQRLAQLGFVFVFCFKTVYKLWDEDLVPREKVKDLIFHYMNYARVTAMPTICLDTTDENLTQQLIDISTRRILSFTSKKEEMNAN